MLFLYAYLATGVAYAVYVYLYAKEAWYRFPINILFGPLVAIYLIYKTSRNEKIRYWD